MNMSFINQKNVRIACMVAFCCLFCVKYVYSAIPNIQKCIFGIVIDNNMSCENFATIEQDMLDYQDIENFENECENVADEDEKPRIFALAKAMRKYRDRMDGFEYSMRAKNGRTLKSLYLQELGM